MNAEYIKLMKVFTQLGEKVIEDRDKSFNSKEVDLLDYYPKGWNSVYTYINENLLRLDSMYEKGDVSKEQFDEKWIDLLNYVKIGYLVMSNRDHNIKK